MSGECIKIRAAECARPRWATGERQLGRTDTPQTADAFRREPWSALP